MPCFRLGAVGTEDMQTKRVNGLFSFAAAEGRDLTVIGLDLLGHAALRLQDADVAVLAAQAPSDAPTCSRFYQQYFRRQGSFPVFERPRPELLEGTRVSPCHSPPPCPPPRRPTPRWNRSAHDSRSHLAGRPTWPSPSSPRTTPRPPTRSSRTVPNGWRRAACWVVWPSR